jgi:hypothetical protein
MLDKKKIENIFKDNSFVFLQMDNKTIIDDIHSFYRFVGSLVNNKEELLELISAAIVEESKAFNFDIVCRLTALAEQIKKEYQDKYLSINEFIEYIDDNFTVDALTLDLITELCKEAKRLNNINIVVNVLENSNLGIEEPEILYLDLTKEEI